MATFIHLNGGVGPFQMQPSIQRQLVSYCGPTRGQLARTKEARQDKPIRRTHHVVHETRFDVPFQSTPFPAQSLIPIASK